MRRTELVTMLSYCRPAGSAAERTFRRRYLLGLPGAFVDTFGNVHVETDPSARVLWSSHTDTVHSAAGRQHVLFDAGTARLPKRSTSRCLGADDTVGVYLMRQMILRGVPGYFVFHHAEERGGIGSSAIARANADWLSRFDQAIALDRQGTGDVVTHQAAGRSASDAYAAALARALNVAEPRFQYGPARGVYTDTAEYVDAIPECTNISVGYYRQHSPEENVDLVHVERLLRALCALDTTALPIVRDPALSDHEWRRDLRARDLWDLDLDLDMYDDDRHDTAGSRNYNGFERSASMRDTLDTLESRYGRDTPLWLSSADKQRRK